MKSKPFQFILFATFVRFRIPPPSVVDRTKPFRALIFDSTFDRFRGAIPLILVAEGSISVGHKIRSYNNEREYEVTEVGIIHPNRVEAVVICVSDSPSNAVFRSCQPAK